MPFAAFRGGFFGLTDEIVGVLRKVGIRIDLSGAPGVVRPDRAADWSNSPSSGYYMALGSYRKPVMDGGENPLFEIPLGWDGKGTDLSRNYLFHERSTYRRLCKVWDAIVARSVRMEKPQFVNFLCHSSFMGNMRFRSRCEKILTYMRAHRGVPVTATEAIRLYEKSIA